jgi:hypothetical protein
MAFSAVIKPLTLTTTDEIAALAHPTPGGPAKVIADWPRACSV